MCYASHNGHISENFPDSGKFNIEEGGVRVPFLARWPGKIAPKTVINEQVGGVVDMLTGCLDIQPPRHGTPLT